MPETRISNGTARQARKALNAFAVNHKDAECIIRTTGGHLTAVVTANHSTPVGMVRLGETKETVEAARIEPKRLADLIKPQGRSDVTMLIHDGMLTCGTLSTPTAPVEDADQSCLDIDLKRRAPAKPCLRVKAQPFAAAIRDAATTTEPGRPVLGCVHISGDGAGQMTVESTDQPRLTRFELDGTPEDGQPFDMVANAQGLKRLAGTFHGDVEISEWEYGLLRVDDGVTCAWFTDTGDFPELRKYYTAKHKGSAEIDGMALAGAVKTVTGSVKDDSVVLLKRQDTLAVSHMVTGMTATVTASFDDGFPDIVAFNPKYLMNALKMMAGRATTGRVRLSGTDQVKPVEFQPIMPDENPDARQRTVVMPMRLPDSESVARLAGIDTNW